MKTQKEITVMKTLSTLFLFIAVIVSMHMTTRFEIDNQWSLFSFILAFASLPIALIGIWMKKIMRNDLTNILLIVVSAGALTSSFFIAPPVNLLPQSLIINNPLQLIECLFLGIVFITFIELAHASIRFSSLVEKTASIKDFRVDSLFKLYFSFFYVPLAVAIILTLFVLNSNLLLKLILPIQFAESVEFNSVYGVAAISALVFVPFAIIVTFLSRKDVFVQAAWIAPRQGKGYKLQRHNLRLRHPPLKVG